MKRHIYRQAVFFTACLSYLWIGILRAQVPSVGTPPGALEEAKSWFDIKAFQTAGQKLPSAEESNLPEDIEKQYILLIAAYEDKNYDVAYPRASTFLFQHPASYHRADVLLMHGISAFQREHTDTALISLNKFIEEAPEHPKRGLAYYWRAQCKLERKDWLSAESDFRQCFEDTLSKDYRDIALLGWALSLERRGDFLSAIANLRRLIAEFPKSNVLNDARIRLASLSLRQSNPREALITLQDTRTPYPSQREESLMLRAEANYQMKLYDSAIVRYERFLQEFPKSSETRKAHYGLAWSLLKTGSVQEAQNELDIVGVGDDSLAITALYQNALISLIYGENKEATARFDSLVQTFPYEAWADNAYYHLGMIAYRTNRYRDARKYFQIASRLYPESELRVNSYRMLGETGIALSDFSNAQYAFSQVRKLNAPDSLLAPSMFQEGVCLYHLGRFKSSAERFTELLRRFPDYPIAAEGYFWKGEALYQDYRFDEAEQAFNEAITRYPGNSKREAATYGIAWSLFEQKKFVQAINAFDQFSKNYPKSNHLVDVSLRKADCYYFIGEYDKAEKLYASLAAIKSDGQYVEYAAFQIAMSYIQRGEAERGIEQLRSFLSRFPKSIYNEVVQFNIAWTYFSKENFVEATHEFESFLQLYPESQLLPRVFFNMGDAFYNQKNYDSARVYYTNVLEQFPQSPLSTDALSGLEFTYRAEGRSADAVAVIEKYISQRPTGAAQDVLLLRKGDILFDQGDFPGAIQEYQRVLSLKPDKAQQTKALQQIGRAYELENNLQAAISTYKDIITNYPDVSIAPSVALSLGQVYMKLKQYSPARETFMDIARLYPTSSLVPEAQYHTGLSFLLQKDTAKGYDQLQLVAAQYSNDVFGERSKLQIARILQTRKQYKASLDTLEALVNRRNDDLAAEALLIMGEDYLLLKRNGDALQAFLDVVEQYTEFSYLVERGRLGAGESYERLHESKKAKKMYEEITAAPVDPEIKKKAEERLKRLR